MSDRERAIMTRHAEYWAELVERSTWFFDSSVVDFSPLGFITSAPSRLRAVTLSRWTTAKPCRRFVTAGRPTEGKGEATAEERLRA
jgi:hypothetical protein